MNAIFISIRYLLLMTVILGGAYPMLVMLMGQTFLTSKSNGSLLMREGKVVGSEFISQKVTGNDLFWSRPSAIDHAAHTSGASNLSATSMKLKADYSAQKKQLGETAPNDLLYSSGSGLDPHISLEAVRFQKVRVLSKRNMTEKDLDAKILEATEDRFLGFMGQPRVNVLKLNMLLQQ